MKIINEIIKDVAKRIEESYLWEIGYSRYDEEEVIERLYEMRLIEIIVMIGVEMERRLGVKIEEIEGYRIRNIMNKELKEELLKIIGGNI